MLVTTPIRFISSRTLLIYMENCNFMVFRMPMKWHKLLVLSPIPPRNVLYFAVSHFFTLGLPRSPHLSLSLPFHSFRLRRHTAFIYLHTSITNAPTITSQMAQPLNKLM